jgi:hypothetical protein
MPRKTMRIKLFNHRLYFWQLSKNNGKYQKTNSRMRNQRYRKSSRGRKSSNGVLLQHSIESCCLRADEMFDALRCEWQLPLDLCEILFSYINLNIFTTNPDDFMWLGYISFSGNLRSLTNPCPRNYK